MFRYTNVRLPIENEEEVLKKLKQSVKKEFEEEIDFMMKCNKFDKDNLLETQDTFFLVFVLKYIIYRDTMGLKIDDFIKRNILGGVIEEFPLEAMNVLIYKRNILNHLSSKVEVISPYHTERGLEDYINLMDFLIFEKQVKEKEKKRK